MPRDGSNIYSQPDPDVVADTTIESAKYNNFTNDVAQDLNLPRPIVAGGTGAVNAIDARNNLDAEVAGTQVTNYDNHVWEAGSFYSLPSATSPPTAHYYSGQCDIMDVDHINLEARRFDAAVPVGPKYIRQKVSGVWKDWEIEGVALGADGSEGIASTSGDMWFGVRINAPGARFAVNTESDLSGLDALIVNKAGTVMVGTATSGTIYLNNLGTQFLGWNSVTGFGLSNSPLTTSHGITTGSDLIVTKNIASLPTQGTIQFGNTGTKFLNYDGTNFNLSGGNLLVATNLNASQITASNTITGTGAVVSKAANASSNAVFEWLDNTGGHRGYAYWSFTDNSLNIQNTAGFEFTLNNAGTTILGAGFANRPGTAGSVGAFVQNFHWTGSALQYWLGSVNTGTVTLTSDYRTKKDVTELPGMWNMVKALRPIRYTQKGYKELFVADNVERWGFVAHELQETLIESAATAHKDAPDAIQSPNPWTVIAALTKALQEAMTRIEALETR